VVAAPAAPADAEPRTIAAPNIDANILVFIWNTPKTWSDRRTPVADRGMARLAFEL
jgi:hypothetical protein